MANITHELRTPIHGILGLSELVTTGVYGAITDKQREAHARIATSARSLLATVDDLLQLSKHEAGKLEVHAAEVDLAELVPEVVGSISWMVGTRDLEIRQRVAGDVGVITSDPVKLRQILVNLLSNAVKFTSEGGHVAVDVARASDGGVVIEVSDTGRGIAAGDLEAIFDEFRQLDGSMEREFGGVGLGLPLVKRLIELLGGEISVTSAVGEGTAFVVALPRPLVEAADAEYGADQEVEQGKQDGRSDQGADAADLETAEQLVGHPQQERVDRDDEQAERQDHQR
jgi:protein-histidine pros-kinase